MFKDLKLSENDSIAELLFTLLLSAKEGSAVLFDEDNKGVLLF